MRKQTIVAGMLIILTCLSGMISGCTEENHPSSLESLQQTLEKAVNIRSVSYQVEISTPLLDTTTTVQIWQKTPYLKEQETTIAGNMSTNQTIIKRPEGLYSYNEALQAYEHDPQTVIPHRSIQEVATDLLVNQSITIQGTETIDGKTTTVIQYNPRETGNSTTMKLWIWNENGFPLKAEHTTIYAESSITAEYTYSNYSFEEIPDSIFTVE